MIQCHINIASRCHGHQLNVGTLQIERIVLYLYPRSRFLLRMKKFTLWGVVSAFHGENCDKIASLC